MKIGIVGGGIVGLAVAHSIIIKRKRADIDIIDRFSIPSSGTSIRNSGVLHSGIYYDPGSLRANLCTTGVKELKDYIKSEKLWINECGKLITFCLNHLSNRES